MRRRFLRIPVLVSLTFLLAVSVVILRSFWTEDLFYSHHVNSTDLCFVSGGAIGYGWRLPHGPEGGEEWYHETRERLLPAHPYWFYADDVWNERSMPLWVALVAPALLAVYFGRARKSRAGFCAACGYDLRASPDGCPECGRLVTDGRTTAMQLRTSTVFHYGLFATVAGAVLAGALNCERRRADGSPPELSTTTLGDFKFDQAAGTIADVPQGLRALDGRRVVVLGEMWDPNEDSHNWELTKLPKAHDWPGPPQVQKFVFCHSAAPVSFYSDEVRATGVLHVKVQQEDGRVVKLYELDVEDVRPSSGPT